MSINGLPLAMPDPDAGPLNNQQADPAYLDRYYEDCVIGGVGAFAIPVRTLVFAAALRRKLVLEIADARRQKAVIVAAHYQKVSALDCAAFGELPGG